MMRVLIITAVASFVLALACFSGAAALGGRELFQHGWNLDISDFQYDDGDVHISIGNEETTFDEIPDVEAPTTNEPATAL